MTNITLYIHIKVPTVHFGTEKLFRQTKKNNLCFVVTIFPVERQPISRQLIRRKRRNSEKYICTGPMSYLSIIISQ